MDGVDVLLHGQDRDERLAMLRTQRNLLFTLHAEITASRRNLGLLDPSAAWSSRSQREYSHRVAEMLGDLDVVLHFLDEALATARNHIHEEEQMCRV
ncbi:hypothetical protein [Cryobacterium sp. PH31-O1]|uniref:hypothetical protein n=1 Tax=Cryobacterium sp. PH31-O1 TaxID=3046306 RepID=UPI0024BB60B1|nr:hypothetical protein [Cryobacterium sp. PH31-O1]MDJ0339793.1 hypothetical protein [Cryobacterium sp. PH31-O1]